MLGEDLHQQKIYFVSITSGSLLLVKMMNQQVSQNSLIDLLRSLYELPQMLDLDLLVHFTEPPFGFRDRFRRRNFYSLLQRQAGLVFDRKFATQSGVDGIQATQVCPNLSRTAWKK